MNGENEKIEAADTTQLLQVPEKAVNKPDNKVISKSERLAEKLKMLCEKREKAFTAQSAAEKKTKEIDEQINKIRTELHNDEIRTLDNLCKSKNLSVKILIDFFTALTDKMPLSEAAALLEIKIGSDDNV